MTLPIIQVGFNKDGEADFSVSAEIGSLRLEKMKELRAMISVAIGTAEGMFLRAKENERPSCQNKVTEIYRTDMPPGKFPGL